MNKHRNQTPDSIKGEAIESLLTRLRIDDGDLKGALARANWIGEVLCNCPEFPALETMLSGSLLKGTGIWPIHDIDVIVILDPERLQYRGRRFQPRALISRLCQRLKQTQTRSLNAGTRDVFTQDHSTRLDMGSQGPHIDFVPAFRARGGYLEIAEKSSGSYIHTSIQKQVDALNVMAQRAPGLREGIMVLKAWKRAAPRRVYLGSYAIELLGLAAAAAGARSALEIVDTTLRTVANTRLRIAVSHAHRVRSSSRLCRIEDLARPDNNVVGHLDARRLDATAEYARKTLTGWDNARSLNAGIRALVGSLEGREA